MFSLVFSCLLTCTYADMHMHGQASTNVLQVTASKYCDFLNQSAASDPDCFYDQHMGSDPVRACIVRTGAPGRWQYEVIAGREDFPVCYVNDFDALCYNAMKVRAGDEENFDDGLKSNQWGFAVDGSENTQTLSLAISPTQEKNNSFFSEATMTKIGLIFLGITMMKEGVSGRGTETAGNCQVSAVERKFIARNDVSLLETGDKTMNKLSPTQKNYGALGSSSPLKERKKDSFGIGKFDGVEMAVVPSEERRETHQQPSGIERDALGKISERSVLSGIHSAQVSVTQKTSSVQVAASRNFHPRLGKIKRLMLESCTKKIVNFLDASQDAKIPGSELVKKNKKDYGSISQEKRGVSNNTIIAEEETALLERS